jgi:hypothetical protein
MAEPQPRSFTEVTFVEAAARRARVDLVIKPVTAGGEKRLISHFLGIAGPGRLALAPPHTVRGKKVFLPVDWQVGMSFELADLWFQATTTVLEHSMFQQFAMRRVDALIVKQPAKVISSRSRREKPRQQVDPAKPFLATIWSADDMADTKHEPLQVGRLHDWTEDGLGVRLAEPLALPVGQRVIIRLDRALKGECIFLWGAFRHCTSVESGIWLTGFGEVTNVKPGEAVRLMEFLSASPD